MSSGYDRWRGSVARALGAMGGGDLAAHWSLCGRFANVRDCGACGETHSAEVRASCGLRGCPWCERVSARERAEAVVRAAVRVADIVRARAAEVEAAMLDEVREASAAVSYWRDREEKARERYALRRRARDLKAAEGHAAMAEKAEGRRKRARRFAAAAHLVRHWRWKLITVSPRYNPRDPSSYTVDGLRHRLGDLRARVSMLWEHALGVGGLAAMTSRVELSSMGHLHAHLLYFGPHVAKSFLGDVAGCFVDVRAVRADHPKGIEGGIREATKYAMKAVSPLRADWIAGDHWRVAHPELVAAWILAARDQQLIVHRGTMRDALAASAACDPPPSPPQGLAPLCRCGAEVCPIGVPVLVSELAKRIGTLRWRELLRVVKDQR